MSRLRDGLTSSWRDTLTEQDRRPYSPHVKVQNKVTAQEANAPKATLATLERDFTPFDGVGLGLSLWRCLGGAWELVYEA